MLRKLIALAVPLLLLPVWLDDSCTCTAIALQSAASRTDLRRLQHTRKLSLSDDTPVVTSFDYDFGYDEIQARHREATHRRQQQRRQPFKSNARATTTTTTTTERPLVQYWNSFLRSVRLPMSNLSLRNLTNPLTNLFNNGGANIIETPPLEDYETDGSSSTSPNNFSKRKQTKRKRKHNDKQRRRPHYPQYENAAAVDSGGGYLNYDNAVPLYYYVQQQPYESLPKTRKGQPIFFYDAHTGHYYDGQSFTAQDYYTQANLYNYYYPTEQLAPADGNDDSEDDDAVSNDVDGELEAEHDPPTLPTRPATQLNESKIETDIEDNADGDVDENADGDVDDNADGNVEVNADVDSAPIDEALKSRTELQPFEQLRNALGMYMRDDSFNRMRQRAPTRDHQKLLAMAKQEPRQQFSYYVLSPL